jgi:hypothetical protein
MNNQISATAIKHLSHALQNNKVKPVLFLHCVFIITQTLTTLTIGHNSIGDKGAKYLAQALYTNKVGDIIFVFIRDLSSYTHIDTDHAQSLDQ